MADQWPSTPQRYGRLKAKERKVRVALIDNETGETVYTTVGSECPAVWRALAIKSEKTGLLRWSLEIREI